MYLNVICMSPQTEHIFIRNFDYIVFGSISVYNTADILILGLTKRVDLVSQDSALQNTKCKKLLHYGELLSIGLIYIKVLCYLQNVVGFELANLLTLCTETHCKSKTSHIENEYIVNSCCISSSTKDTF